MSSKELTGIIRKIKDLPTLPRTMLRITETINHPQSSAQDLAAIITDDQVLTARLLKLVNSSFYGFPQKISTVTTAIVLLGFDAIRNLLLTSSVFNLFSSNKKRKIAEMEAHWDHSFGCALGAKIIGDFLRYEKVEELFVAGLLHDIGKIVEMMFLPEDFSNVASMVKEQNILFITAEERVLGYTHAEIGKLLAEKWNLPPKLIHVIACHHHPVLAGVFTREAAIVHLADILCRALNIGSGGDSKMPALNREGWECLQLETGSIELIMEKIEDEFDNIRALMSHTL